MCEEDKIEGLHQVTRGRLWQPFRQPDPSARSTLARILLAHYEARYRGLRQKMRQVPKVRTYSTHARRDTELNDESLAIHVVGDGYCRPITHRGRSKEIFAGGH